MGNGHSLDLHGLLPEFAARFAGAGWTVLRAGNGDLALVRNGVRIHPGTESTLGN